MVGLRKFMLFLIFVLFAVGFILPNVSAIIDAQDEININFFYGNGCPHCADMEEIFDELSSDYNFNIKGYEIYSNNANRLKLIETYEEFGYNPASGGVPTYTIEDRIIIIGKIQKTQLITLLDTITKEYSYSDFKLKIKPAYQTTEGDISITSSTFDYGIIRIKEKIEDKPIIPINNTNTTNQTTDNNQTQTNQINNNTNQTNSTNDPNQGNQTNSNLTWSVLIPAALVDSINPCTFAVMAILLAAVLLSKGKKHVLASGLAFTVAIFLSYLLLGFGIFAAVTSTGAQNVFFIIITILAFLMAYFEIKSYFRYKAGFGAVEMPMFLRPKLKKLMRFVDSPIIAFLIGLVCSLFLLPCSSGPYLMVLALLAKQASTLNIMYLMAYNLIFILPLLIITFLVSLGITTVSHIHRKKEQYIKQLHLISGILILLIINFLTIYLSPVLKYLVLMLVTIFEISLIIMLLIKFIKHKQ